MATTTTATAAATPEKRVRKNAYAKVESKLWAIHGQYYDLASFVDSHPGGSEMLLLGRGRDCTEMFESVHALSKRNVHALLAKYRVDAPAGAAPAPTEMFAWKSDGFYSVLAQRVRKHFEETDPAHYNYKATSTYWFKVTAFFVTWLALIYHAFTAGSLLAGLMAGFVMNILGFCVMHDGSHYGISKNPWVNRVLHTLWSDWNLWSHFLWLRHHTYGHHSYTGVYRRDPDLVNGVMFFRKHSESPYYAQHSQQWWVAYVLLWLFPNQHLGQSLLYLRSWIVKTVFGVPLERMSAVDLMASTAIYLPSLFFHLVLPFQLLPASTALPMMALYWGGQGLGYALNIIPNHDTFETHSLVGPAPNGLRDWGEQQLLGSGNHTTDGGLWSVVVSTLWGGMNYQIEHHLFPSVSHVHYPAISKIVRETSAEFNLPYTTHSWFHAILSFGKTLGALSLRSSFRPSDAPPPKQRKQD
jgi:fatty acid desaturase